MFRSEHELIPPVVDSADVSLEALADAPLAAEFIAASSSDQNESSITANPDAASSSSSSNMYSTRLMSAAYSSDAQLDPEAEEHRLLSLPLHPQLKLAMTYLFIHTVALGILSISVPKLLLHIYDGDESRSAYTASWTAALTSGMGFFIYPVLAMLSDYYGRKPFVLGSLLGTTAAFVVLGVFANIPALIVASVIRGFTDVSYTITYCIVGDTCEKRIMVKRYGGVQGCAGLGILFGPLLAIAAQQVETYRVPFFLAACVELCNTIFVAWRFRETLFFFSKQKQQQDEASAATVGGVSVASGSVQSQHDGGRRGSEDSGGLSDAEAAHVPASILNETLSEFVRKRTLNPFKSLRILRSSPALWCLALALFFTMTTFSGAISVFYLYTHRRFNWDSTQNTALLFLVGCMSIFSNAVLLPYLLKRSWMDEMKILTLAMCCSLGQNLSWALTPSSFPWLLYILTVALCPSFFLFTKIRALVSRQIEPNKQGELQGALTCLVSLASILGPLSLNGIFGYFSSDDAVVKIEGAPFFLSFLLNSACASLLYYACTRYIHRVSPSTVTIQSAVESAAEDQEHSTRATTLAQRILSHDHEVSVSASRASTVPSVSEGNEAGAGEVAMAELGSTRHPSSPSSSSKLRYQYVQQSDMDVEIVDPSTRNV